MTHLQYEIIMERLTGEVWTDTGHSIIIGEIISLGNRRNGTAVATLETNQGMLSIIEVSKLRPVKELMSL